MIGGVILWLGWLLSWEKHAIGQQPPKILMSSVPNYLFHRYLPWLSPVGNHEADVSV